MADGPCASYNASWARLNGRISIHIPPSHSDTAFLLNTQTHATVSDSPWGPNENNQAHLLEKAVRESHSNVAHPCVDWIEGEVRQACGFISTGISINLNSRSNHLPTVHVSSRLQTMRLAVAMHATEKGHRTLPTLTCVSPVVGFEMGALGVRFAAACVVAHVRRYPLPRPGAPTPLGLGLFRQTLGWRYQLCRRVMSP